MAIFLGNAVELPLSTLVHNIPRSSSIAFLKDLSTSGLKGTIKRVGKATRLHKGKIQALCEFSVPQKPKIAMARKEIATIAILAKSPDTIYLRLLSKKSGWEIGRFAWLYREGSSLYSPWWNHHGHHFGNGTYSNPFSGCVTSSGLHCDPASNARHDRSMW